jgi:hypothetical protein
MRPADALIDSRHFPLGTAAVSLLGFEHPDQAIPAIIRWNTVSAHG